MHLSDQELVDMLKHDDEEAFREIYDRYFLKLYYTAFKYLKDRDQAGDVCQNIFLDLWNRRNTLEIKTLVGFLHQARRYQVLNLVARRKVHDSYFEHVENMVSAFEATANDEAYVVNEKFTSPFRADDDVYYHEQHDVFRKFLDVLPEKRRKMFQMRFQEGISMQEIADKMNISYRRVKNQTALDAKNLRTRLSEFLSILF